MTRIRRENASHGFTLIEILVALVITSILTMAIYSFFIGQHHAYTVQDQVIEMEQNARAAMDMIRRDLRMAGYHAMGDDLINNLSDFVPSSFIPTYPVTVNLDANPKISEGSGTDPDVITFLSVVPTNNNPTTISTDVSAGATEIPLALNSSDTATQYNVGDMIHIGSTSEYATITAISDNILTIDTNPADTASNLGVVQNYAAGTPIGEIYVISYAVFNDDNDPAFERHDPGHPVLKRKANGGGFQPVAENITDMQLRHMGSGEIEVTLASRTDRADHKFQTNGGYRTYTTSARVKARNMDTVAVGTDCAVPAPPDNLVLTGLDDTYPCKIHITWDPVAGDTGCEVNKYIIYYGTTSKAYPYSVDVGDVAEYTLDVTSLTGCTYYVTVAAVNSAGTSLKSAERSLTDVLPPATPAAFTGENINGVERKVVFAWEKNSECDLQGYNIYGKSESVDGDALQINDPVIPKEFINYTDANFIPIDCATYNYHIEAVDYCPNASAVSDVVSVSPGAPAPPTGPVFTTTDGVDTISWTLSADDFNVGDLNYITGYRVYGPDNELLDDTLGPGINSWTSGTSKIYYDVSAKDYCNNESDKLRISSSCTSVPDIIIENPGDTATVSETITIDGTAYAPSERTITSVKLKIDQDPWITIGNTSDWECEWDTTKVENGTHTITIRATDSVGCYGEDSINVTVSNSPPVTPQVFCALSVCKDIGNSPIYLVVYVYDHNGEPVSDASVRANILFGSGTGSKEIPPTETPGYYGGGGDAKCNLYTNNDLIPVPTDNLAIASTYEKYANNSETEIVITVSKEGFLGSTCTIIAK